MHHIHSLNAITGLPVRMTTQQRHTTNKMLCVLHIILFFHHFFFLAATVVRSPLLAFRTKRRRVRYNAMMERTSSCVAASAKLFAPVGVSMATMFCCTNTLDNVKNMHALRHNSHFHLWTRWMGLQPYSADDFSNFDLMRNWIRECETERRTNRAFATVQIAQYMQPAIRNPFYYREFMEVLARMCSWWARARWAQMVGCINVVRLYLMRGLSVIYDHFGEIKTSLKHGAFVPANAHTHTFPPPMAAAMMDTAHMSWSVVVVDLQYMHHGTRRHTVLLIERSWLSCWRCN